MKQSKGFTLIELMIVVAIVGILAAIAYPSYQEQIRSSRRGDCAGALAGLANAMERFYTTNNTYVGAAVGGGANGAPNPLVLNYPATCPLDGGTAPTYNLTIAATASTYTLSAAPVGTQAADTCGTLTLTNTGSKNVIGQSAGKTWQDCW
jgi:type IV pilus assembly protein PilE